MSEDRTGRDQDYVRQAGAIAFRKSDGAPRVLLVQAQKDPRHWVFPKGHLEPGETTEVAAERELLEEAGVVGRVVGYVGTLRFDSGDEAVRVDYHLVRAHDEGDSAEGRRTRWCTREEADEILTFDDARGLLAETWPVIEAS